VEGREAGIRGASPSRWWVLAVVALVAFITTVDATIVVVARPRMMAGLHIPATAGLWTLIAYIITSTVLLLPAGRWSDAAGRRPTFLLGMLIFSGATVLCGVAPSGAFLIGARLLQGAGAALGLATAVPLIVEAFPPGQLGRALGINSTAWVLGSIIGPVAAGALVATRGWRWVFFVTVPFGLAGWVGGWWALPRDRPRARRPVVDGAGLSASGSHWSSSRWRSRRGSPGAGDRCASSTCGRGRRA